MDAGQEQHCNEYKDDGPQRVKPHSHDDIGKKKCFGGVGDGLLPMLRRVGKLPAVYGVRRLNLQSSPEEYSDAARRQPDNIHHCASAGRADRVFNFIQTAVTEERTFNSRKAPSRCDRAFSPA